MDQLSSEASLRSPDAIYTSCLIFHTPSFTRCISSLAESPNNSIITQTWRGKRAAAARPSFPALRARAPGREGLRYS